MHRLLFASPKLRRIPFDDERLALAIATRDRSYKLLLWISDAIDKGLIHSSRAARHSGGPDAAGDWLRTYFEYIPEELRPPKESIGEFGAFFSTYLTSSFDVVEKPGTKGVGPAELSGCRCEICLRIINAPHLQAKKLDARDKQRANFLMTECLTQLARENGLAIQEQLATQLVTDQATRRFAAYVAYGDWLIRRLAGESDGPAVLALWRIIAWDPRGGMRRAFSLHLDDFRIAEALLLDEIRRKHVTG